MFPAKAVHIIVCALRMHEALLFCFYFASYFHFSRVLLFSALFVACFSFVRSPLARLNELRAILKALLPPPLLLNCWWSYSSKIATPFRRTYILHVPFPLRHNADFPRFGQIFDKSPCCSACTFLKSNLNDTCWIFISTLAGLTSLLRIYVLRIIESLISSRCALIKRQIAVCFPPEEMRVN